MHTLLGPATGGWPLFGALYSGHGVATGVCGGHGRDAETQEPSESRSEPIKNSHQQCELLTKLRKLMRSGVSPLHRAARAGDACLVGALLESQGFLPPEAAAAAAAVAWAAAHRQHKADNNSSSSSSSSRTFSAELSGVDAISSKHDSNSSSNCINYEDQGLQHLLLLRLIMHPDAPDARGDTALHYACRAVRQHSPDQTTRVLQLLLSAGAHADARNYAGQAPSMILVGKVGGAEAVACLELLQRHGADMRVVDERGRSLLMRAAAAGNADAVQWLLRQGVNAQHTDARGLQAWQYAEYPELRHVLRAASAPADCCPSLAPTGLCGGGDGVFGATKAATPLTVATAVPEWKLQQLPALPPGCPVLDPGELVWGAVLGCGDFGVVHGGSYRGQPVAIKVLRWHMAETHSLLEAYTQELAALSHMLLRHQRRRRQQQRHHSSPIPTTSTGGPSSQAATAAAAAAAGAEAAGPASAEPLTGDVADLAPAGTLGEHVGSRARVASDVGDGGGETSGDDSGHLHSHVLDFKGVVTRRDGVQALVLGRCAHALSDEGLLPDGLGPEQRFRVALQVAQGMAAVHEDGVIHLDLKTANVLLDASGNVQVCDFGMAVVCAPASGGGWQPQVFAPGAEYEGHPLWSAPELIHCQPYTSQADVWSWGLLLFQLATWCGADPFASSLDPDVVAAVLEDARCLGPRHLAPYILAALPPPAGCHLHGGGGGGGGHRAGSGGGCDGSSGGLNFGAGGGTTGGSSDGCGGSGGGTLHPAVHQLIRDCLEVDPTRRPSMRQVVQRMERMAHDSSWALRRPAPLR